jgi:hypothetical protein
MERIVEMVQQLWMPIVLSAVLVFIASAIIWMATPLHKHDYKDPGDKEDAILGLVRSAALAPGVYMVPWCHGKQKDPAAMERMKMGPWAILTVLPGFNFGKSLAVWFVHLLIIGFFVAYLTANARAWGADYLEVFRIAGTTAFLAYAGYALPMAIWHAMPWRQVPGRIIDGLVYALLTAGTFAWLWPDAPGVSPLP